ncbi:MAG: hypothetical protein Q4G68_12305 [Planctomycetia bacterium]|nr:hypothetical protein [Planctomycetia bacterium]
MKIILQSLCIVFLLVLCRNSSAAELWLGKATVDISPPRPVCLQGQFHTRIAEENGTPVYASVLNLQARVEGQTTDEVLFVTLDVCFLTKKFMDVFRDELARALPDFDQTKLILSATHTHTSFSLGDPYVTDRADVMTPDEVNRFIAEKVVPKIVECRTTMVPCQYTYALGHASVAQCRRTVYFGGESVMYGNPKDENFDTMEAGDDSDLSLLYFDDRQGNLIAVAIDVPCPAQTVEGWSLLHADFWHNVRMRIAKCFGPDVAVLPLCGSAGDASPHLLLNKSAEERMRTLRGLDELDEIARRIVREVEDCYPIAKKAMESDVILRHERAVISVPQALVSKQAYEEAKANAERLFKKSQDAPDHGARGDYLTAVWNQSVVDRYEQQQGSEHPTFAVPIHVLRIGDLAIATNPFELYSDFARRIKARSNAVQTTTVQLADFEEIGCYLPTQRAISGGSYGGTVFSFSVGPEGGQQIVEQSLKMINGMFE